MADEAKKQAPPYVSFKTFKNRITGLGASGLPQRIDTSIFSTDSGATQTQLMGAMKYLGLIDESGGYGGNLEALASGDANRWQLTLRQVMEAAYSKDQITALEGGTLASLHESLKGPHGLSGSTLDKVVRFLIAAAEDAGLKVSPHIKKAKPAAGGGRRRVKRKQDDIGNGLGAMPQGPDPSAVTLPIPLGRRNGQLILPRDFSKRDLPLLKAALAMAEAMAEANESEQDDDDA